MRSCTAAFVPSRARPTSSAYKFATQKLDAVTNTDTGFFRPIPLGGDELIVFRYTGQGLVPARITVRPLDDVAPVTFLGERTIAKHPVLKTWLVGSPAATVASVSPQPAAPAPGVYRLGGGLGRESFYPIVQGYKNTQAIGWRVNLSDPLQLNRASVSLSVSPWSDLPGSERIHLRGDYERYDWTAHAAWNDADFYDLFGPTKVSRKGYNVTVAHSNTLVFDQPKRMTLKLEGVAAGNLDQLPQYQNVAGRRSIGYSAEAELSYTDVRSSLGHVDDEKGRRLVGGVSHRLRRCVAVPRLFGHYDVGWALPAAHSSLWLRTAGGFSPQRASEPFANFFFGGFGNNYVDHGEIKRYREYHAFPGARSNEIGGRNFVRSLLEWELPPIRFSRAGTPGFYLSFLRPALFAGGLVTNLERSARRTTAATAGGQVDLRFTMLSALDLTLSVGAGVRLDQRRARAAGSDGVARAAEVGSRRDLRPSSRCFR